VAETLAFDSKHGGPLSSMKNRERLNSSATIQEFLDYAGNLG